MNNRIEKLMLEAGFAEYVTETKNQLIHQPIFNAEKFAELIINECATVCLSQRDPANLNYKPSEQFAEEIKRHFGIK
jgi:hypothetical protein